MAAIASDDFLAGGDLDERHGVVGTSGSGKTYAAKGLIERLIGQGARVCVVDPLGAWWGLRAGVDGAPEGGLDVVIFGGAHGDIPIDDSKGAAIGRIVGESDIRCVIDLKSLGSGAARRRFMVAFTETISEINREPLHLVLDEADLWAPQRPMHGTEILLNHIEEIVRRGRMGGFIPWLITQKPAVLNKNVLELMDALIIMRLPGPRDRGAIQSWIEGHGSREQERAVLAALPTLVTGEGYYWAPTHGLLARLAFPANRTFDSSQTPKRGDPLISATLAPVSLARIARLMATPPDAPATAGQTLGESEPAQAVKDAEGRGFARGLAAGREEGRGEITRLRALFARVDEEAMRAQSALLALRIAVAEEGAEPVDNTESGRTLVPPTVAGVADSPPLRAAPWQREVLAALADAAVTRITFKSGRGSANGLQTAKPPDLTPAAWRLLRVMVGRHPVVMTWGLLATLAGMAPRGGSFNRARASLRANGMVHEDKGTVSPSDTALALMPREAVAIDTPEKVLAMWAERLPTPAGEVLRELAASGPGRAEDLALALGRAPRGGSWNRALAILRRNGLVVEANGVIALAAGLANGPRS